MGRLEWRSGGSPATGAWRAGEDEDDGENDIWCPHPIFLDFQTLPQPLTWPSAGCAPGSRMEVQLPRGALSLCWACILPCAGPAGLALTGLREV